MKNIVVLTVSVCLLSFSLSPVLAADTAKSVGMAGAVIAVDDNSALVYNPALLANMQKMQVGYSMSGVRQAINFDSTDPTLDGLSSDVSELALLDNISFITPLGPGSIYVGFITEKRFFGNIVDIPTLGGVDVAADTTMYAPTIAYGLKVSPALSLGAAMSFNYKAYSCDFDFAAGSVPIRKISRNLGVNLGALYTLTPQIDLGASLSLQAPSSINGYADASDLPDQNYNIEGYCTNPSIMRLGGSYRPQENINVGLQFDIINGFSLYHTETLSGDGGDQNSDASLQADTVIATRVGAEYTLSMSNAKVPLRAGFCFIPSNRLVADPQGSIAFVAPILDAVSYLDDQVPNTTAISLGAGYNTEAYELGLSASLITGTGAILFSDPTARETLFNTFEQKIVASAKFFI